jgi:hypothetical protein
MAVVSKLELNEAFKSLASKDRPAAVAILARYDALSTPELKPEDIPAVHAAFIEALDARAKP